MTTTAEDQDGSQLVQRLHDDYALLQREEKGAAKWLNETRFDIRSLTTILSRLPKLETITFKYEPTPFPYFYLKQDYCEVSQAEMSRPFISTLAALAASGTRVKHILLHDEMDFGAVSIGCLEALAPALRSFDAVFERLETLKLNLRDWRTPHEGFEVDRTRLPFVVRFLAKCTRVRVLELSCYSALEEDLFGGLARTCRLENLEQCTLGYFRVCCADDLISFLTPSAASLRELRLQQFANSDPSATWPHILTSLSDTTSCLQNLNTLSLDRLITRYCRFEMTHVVFASQTLTTLSLQVRGEQWRAKLRYHASKTQQRSAWMDWVVSAREYPFNVSGRPIPNTTPYPF